MRLPLLLLAGVLCAPAQEDVFRTEARLVVLHATVVDKHGRPLTVLPRNAFHVFEDSAEQSLKVFRREDIPVSLGLIIDNSLSMRTKRARIEAAALALVKASNPQDEAFVINFNDDVFRDVEFTSALPVLQKGLERIDSAGGTALYDAIAAGSDYARRKGKHDKKVLVVITDGNDNMSRETFEEVVRAVQSREVLVYAIGLLSEEEPAEAKRARRALSAITRASGGEVYFPESADDVGAMALNVAHEIRSQYILAYSPLNTRLDGSYRRIRVTVEWPDKPVVRTRTGYYALAAPAARR